MSVDLVIIGAGPYGLSLAAHLRKTNVTFRIFGSPMQSWRSHMPKGMMLKSEGFASDLYDPDSSFTLRHYCEERKIPYAEVGLPVPLDVFSDYGLEFQKRFAPSLEETDITSVRRTSAGFEIKTADGQTVHARKVVMAVGITHFDYLPAFLSGLPSDHVTHSSQHHDLSGFRGKSVVVIGAGASAVDIAAILHEVGSQVELVARRPEIEFHTRGSGSGTFLQNLKTPRSGLGPGWRSRLCTDAPLLFHTMPQKLRFRVVRNHLGPAPGWFVRDKVVGKFPLHTGCKIESASVEDGKVHLRLVEKDGSKAELIADHLICATGYHPSVSRLQILDDSLRREIRTVEDTPVLTRHFETSVPGLYMVGLASANSFGPMMRFAFGANYTAKRIRMHLAAKPLSSDVAEREDEPVGFAAD